MTESDKLTFCLNCKSKKWTESQGIVCQLTGKKPGFENVCPSYMIDKASFESQRNSILAKIDFGIKAIISPDIYNSNKSTLRQTLKIRGNSFTYIFFILVPFIMVAMGVLSVIKEGSEPGLFILLTIVPVFIGFYGYRKFRDNKSWLILDKERGLVIPAEESTSNTEIPWDKLIIAVISYSRDYAASELFIYHIGRKDPLIIKIETSNIRFQSLVNKIELYRQQYVR